MRLRYTLLSILCLLCVTQGAFAKDVTPETWAVAVKTAVAGEDLVLASNELTPTYYDGGQFVSDRNGNAILPIRLRAKVPGMAIIRGCTPTRLDALFFNRCSYWNLEDLVIEGGQHNGLRFGSCDRMTITRCTVRNNGVTGLLAGNTSNCRVSDSIFYGNKEQHGAYVSSPGVHDWIFERCTFSLNGRSGCQINSQGGPGPVISNCQVVNCSITNNGQFVKTAAGINCLGVINSVFAGNTVTDNGGTGISFAPNGREGGESTGNLVTNCAVTFRSGVGGSCVQTTKGTQSVSGCRLWVGRSTPLPLNALSGGVLVAADNIVLPVAPATVPTPDPVAGPVLPP